MKTLKMIFISLIMASVVALHAAQVSGTGPLMVVPADNKADNKEELSLEDAEKAFAVLQFTILQKNDKENRDLYRRAHVCVNAYLYNYYKKFYAPCVDVSLKDASEESRQWENMINVEVEATIVQASYI